MSYQFFCGTRLLISDDACVDLERELQGLPAGPVLLITDSGVLRAGIVDRLLPALRSSGRSFESFAEVPGNPGVDTVEAALSAARRLTPAVLAPAVVAPAVVVAVGGGSCIDVAKAVGVLVRHEGISWSDLQSGTAKITRAGTPVFAIPTTAGTGSEVSHVAVIGATDGFKKGVVHAALFPSLALIDGGLTLTLPRGLTAATGADALVHAIEAYLGRRANPMTDMLALAALADIVRWLPVAVANGGDIQARRAMAQAAAWAGIAMDLGGLGLCHALCGPLAAHHDVHHGLGNAILLPAVLAYNAPALPPGRWPALRATLGLADGATPADLSAWARTFLGSLGLPMRLSEAGIGADAFAEMAQEATRMAMIGNNVRPAAAADCQAVLEAAR